MYQRPPLSLPPQPSFHYHDHRAAQTYVFNGPTFHCNPGSYLVDPATAPPVPHHTSIFYVVNLPPPASQYPPQQPILHHR